MNGQREKDCFNCGEHSGSCRHIKHFQCGGGWTPRSYVLCAALRREIYVIPDCATNDPRIPLEHVIIPADCPEIHPRQPRLL